MKTMRPMNQVIIGGIIISLLIGFIVPSSIASIKTYPQDGVWEDTFDDNKDLVLSNCQVINGEITLKKDTSLPKYDFKEQSNHLFYFYKWYFFFPNIKFFSPETHHNRESDPLGGRDIDNISKSGDKSYTSRTSSTLQRVIVHHFRLYVDFDAASAGYIMIPWYGKASSGAVIDFYYWNSTQYLWGSWVKLGQRSSTGADISVNYSISGGAVKYAVGPDNYVDISVVAYYPLLFKSCTLSTDYIGLYSSTLLGYSTKNAHAKTKVAIYPIAISNISSFYWDLLAWDDYQTGGAKVRYHVFYINKTGDPIEVENSTLPGNKQGFTTSPVSLRNLSDYKYHNKYNNITIQANLTTESRFVTPRIFNWAVTWQNGARWQDSFSTYYRIDERSKINKFNGTIMISQIQDEWPVFGFNSENTRASSSKGALTKNRYWYSTEYYVGGGFRNPVIGNGLVYIFSNRKSLLRYDAALPTGSAEGKTHSNQSFTKFKIDIVNSPAVTDELVIIATGQQADKGYQNRIYGYQIDNLTEKWNYSTVDNICYDASPVVVDNTLFISTWGGDNGYYLIETNRYTNNKLIALDITDGRELWNYTLPASGLSTPAVTDDVIIVTCNSTNNDSVFALTRDGEKLWSKTVGAIAHSSPVIYGNAVFLTCTKEETNRKSSTKIVALDLSNNGTYLWNVTVSGPLPSSYMYFSDSTPAVYDGVLYVASPNGTVYAIGTANGTTLWSKSIYTISSSKVLRSSPAYAGNTIYIGTPEGKIKALNATTGATVWEDKTFPDETGKSAMIIGSPIVSNGLVYIADENGYLYCYGKFIPSTNEVSGSITSVPIRLPESYWWGSFYANVSYTPTISTIKFKLLDENGNVLKNDMTNGSNLSLMSPTLGRVVRLQADFSSHNISKDNPKLYRWYITLTSDTAPPHLISSSFTPDPNGWLPEIVPSFSIVVKDNKTGLRVTTAKYTLEYITNNVTQWITHLASCTGQNGTTDVQTMTMNISELPFYDNITSLKSIMFNITDVAGNTASKTVKFKQDTKKPTSYVKTLSMKRYNSTFIIINATSNDTGTLNVDASGIRLVQLFYRYSEDSNFSDAGDWILFANSTKSVPTWNFNFSDDSNQHGGYFELCTVAIDFAGHVEDFPSTGDVSFLYDWKRPDPPNVWGETLWFKERPRFSVVFEDDYRLDTIQYRPNFETLWTTIATHINKSIYDTDDAGNTWSLKQDYWDQMNEDEVYYLYFRINDTLGNTLEVTSNNQAIIIRKDTVIPIVTVDVPSLETEWSWTDNFTVSGIANDQEGSGIKEVLLYYRYSEDKSNWSSWAPFGDVQDFSPFEWNFNAAQGDGYYEFKINVTDNAENTVESPIFSLAIASFPQTPALVLLGLVVVLLLVSSIIFLKWRKKKTT